MFSKSSKKGFTLVELLVVISIIAILSVVGVTIFSGVQKNARDSKRKEDISAITKAWEITYVTGQDLPYQPLADSLFASGKIPTDPRDGSSYFGINIATAVSSFIVCARLENPTGNATSSLGANLGTVTNGGYFCNKNSR